MEFNFRNIAKVLAPYMSDPHEMIEVSDLLLKNFPDHKALASDAEVGLKSPDGTAHWNGSGWVYSHALLVERALNNNFIMDEVRAGRKIQAIKHLRNNTFCGLKQAKEAIEDERIWASYAPVQSVEDQALQALRDKLAYNPDPTKDDPWNNNR